MTFGEKVKKQRKELKITQLELAKQIGITNRAVTSYETNKSRPRGLENYKKLAAALQVNINYLLNEDEEFLVKAHDTYGSRGAKQAEKLVDQMGALFSGGELSSKDKDAVMKAMQEIYWETKEENKKYTPKKFLTATEE